MTCPITSTEAVGAFFTPAENAFTYHYLNKGVLKRLKERGLNMRQRRDYVTRGYRNLFSVARVGYYSALACTAATIYPLVRPSLESLVISGLALLALLPIIPAADGVPGKVNVPGKLCEKLFKRPSIEDYIQ